MKRKKAEITISSESDEEIDIKREPYSPKIKPGCLPCDDFSDDIDGKFLPVAKRKKIDDNTSQNSIQVKVQYCLTVWVYVKLDFFDYKTMKGQE